MARNAWGKMVGKDKAYAKVEAGGWTWYVLKAYKSRANELKDRYARWFCLVVSPFTGELGDMGDTYVNDIPMTQELAEALADRVNKEEE